MMKAIDRMVLIITAVVLVFSHVHGVRCTGTTLGRLEPTFVSSCTWLGSTTVPRCWLRLCSSTLHGFALLSLSCDPRRLLHQIMLCFPVARGGNDGFFGRRQVNVLLSLSTPLSDCLRALV